MMRLIAALMLLGCVSTAQASDVVLIGGNGTIGVVVDATIDAAGDLLVGTGDNAAGRLAIGANNTVLQSDGTTAEWVTNLDVAGDVLVTGSDVTIGAAGVKLTGSADGDLTILGIGDNAADFDESITLNLEDTENTLGISSATGVTTISTGAIGLASTGIISGKVGVITKAADYTLGTDAAREAYGYLVTVTSTATVTLPAVAIGMSVCVYSTTAAAVHVDANAADRIILNGAALADGDKVTSASGAGDYICLVGESADGWLTMARSGTWADGN